MPALLYRLEAWGKVDRDEMNEILKIQVGPLKSMLTFLISTSYIDPVMQTGTCLTLPWL